MNNVSPLQPFTNMKEFIKLFKDEQTCIRFYVNLCFAGKPDCPKCGHHSKPMDEKRFRCCDTNCRKVFSFKVNTVFENSKPFFDEWFLAIYLLLRDNVSSHQLSEDIGISQKSTWFMLHRLRFSVDQNKMPIRLGKVNELGERKKVAMDEGTFGGSNPFKHAFKQRAGTQGRSSKGKKIFVGACESDGDVVLQLSPNTNKNTLQSFITAHIEEGSDLSTDEHTGYEDAGLHCNHHTTNHGAKHYVEGKWHSNDMENFFFHFFTDMSSTHIHFSAEHAQKYADYFAYCWNTRKINIVSRFIIFLLQTVDCRLTYRQLIAK